MNFLIYHDITDNTIVRELINNVQGISERVHLSQQIIHVNNSSIFQHSVDDMIGCLYDCLSHKILSMNDEVHLYYSSKETQGLFYLKRKGQLTALPEHCLNFSSDASIGAKLHVIE